MKINRMVKKSILTRVVVFVFVLSILSSCQDPILVGGSLLDDEKLNIGFTNTFDLSTSVISGDRVVTHQPNLDSKTYLLGKLVDPLFGTISSELFMKFQFSSTKPEYQVNEKLRFDSLVLVLQYDTLGTYGNTKSVQSIKVYQLDEIISNTDTFYADTNLKYLPTEIAKVDKNISPKDSVKIIDHLTGKLVTQVPQLRLRLDNSVGEALLNNENAAKNDTIFREYFKGVYIKSSSPTNEPFMYGFNFNAAALSTLSPVNKLIMYYTANDTTEKTYEYLINTATINRFVHDRDGSQVTSFMMDTSKSDSLSFLQGIGGVKTVIKFNDLSSLNPDSIAINKAELEITVADISTQNGIYNLPKNLIATRKNEDGKLIFIDDISQLLSGGVSFVTSFGGTPNTSGTLRKYNLNITNHIKQAVKNKSFDSDIYLNVLTEPENPSRLIFYGAKHSQYPVKLKVTYTKI